MRFRHLFFLYALILGLTCYQFANAEHVSATPTPSRPAASGKLGGAVLEWLAALLGTDKETIDSYEAMLTNGLEAALQQKQEAKVAEGLTQLFGGMHEGQIANAADSLPMPTCQDEKPNSSRRESLMNRLFWTAEWILKRIGQPGPSSCDSPAKARYVAMLDGNWQKVQERSDELHRKLDLAGENGEARAELLRELGPKKLFKFAQTQADSGNEALAGKIYQKLSFPTAEGHGLDLVAPDGSEHRVMIPKDSHGAVTAVRDFSRAQGGLDDYAIAGARHGSPRLFAGRPRVAAPEGPGTTGGGVTTGDGGAPKGGNDGGGNGSEGAKNPTSPERTHEGEGAGPKVDGSAVMVARCFTCHSPDKKKRTFRIDAAGNSVGEDGVGAAIERAVEAKDMPPGGGLSDDDREAIRQWASGAR